MFVVLVAVPQELVIGSSEYLLPCSCEHILPRCTSFHQASSILIVTTFLFRISISFFFAIDKDTVMSEIMIGSPEVTDHFPL